MQDFGQVSISRRVLIAGTALMLSGCKRESPTLAKNASFAVGDSHAHLFNAADLPIANFVQYVILPNRYSTMPGWAKAMIDLFARFYKTLAITAQAELSLVAGLAPNDLDPDAFGARIAEFINREMDAASVKTGDAEALELARSYRILNAAVAADAGGAKAGFVDSERASPSAFAEVARKSETNSVAPGEKLDNKLSPAFQADSPGDAVRLVVWGYELLRSRDAHVRTYLARFRATGALPDRMINHLVDYDSWLDDGPARGPALSSRSS